MPEAPERKTPPLVLMRPSHDWISRIHSQQKRLAELELSEDRRRNIERWTEIEFVYSTLALEGYEIPRDHISRLASSQTSETSEATSETDRQAIDLLESLRRVMRLAGQHRKNALLSPELLLELHNLPGSEAGLRQQTGSNSAAPRPERLRAAVESACHWFTAESFTEFHPVEQASLVLLRLIDIEPFDRSSERTAFVAASLFTLRGELPPVTLGPEMKAAYRSACVEATRMNTKPMVDLIAAATEKSITDIMEVIIKN